MKIDRMIVTGDYPFLRRYRPLCEALSLTCEQLHIVPRTHRSYFHQGTTFQKSQKVLTKRANQLEQKIYGLPYKPDFALHMFDICYPFWEPFNIPYGIYLDYTAMLAQANWPKWGSFTNSNQLDSWKNCEYLVYQRATHLFVMSQAVKQSLIKDYNIKPDKITVVGCVATFNTVYEGEKTFGSQQILFDGSDFERKGGDLVIDAFRQVRSIFPGSKLVIIGRKLSIQQDGIYCLERVDSRTMRRLFLETDVVVAPSRCDPFPSFVLEAMRYGVPCIVSDHDAMPEIVDRGHSGVVVHLLTAGAISNQIINLLTDLPRLVEISQAARKKVKTDLTCRQVSRKIMQTLLAINLPVEEVVEQF